MQRRHITLYAQYVLCFKAYALQDGRHNLHTLFFIHASSGLKCYPCFFGSTTLRICFVKLETSVCFACHVKIVLLLDVPNSCIFSKQ